MKVKALKEHRYGGRLYKVGAQYEINGAGDLKLYKALGRVTEAPADIAILPAPTSKVADEPPVEIKPKRTYRRRDLTAEPAATTSANTTPSETE